MPNSLKRFLRTSDRDRIGWVIFLVLLNASGISQHPIQYTAAFTHLIEEHHLVFDLPESSWYKVTSRQADALTGYDLILESHREKMEIRYRLQPANNMSDGDFRRQFIAMLSTLATNDDDAYMAFNQIGSYLAMDRYHAERAMIARFQTKYEVSPLRYARMLQLYHSWYGIITCLVLYEDKNQGELAQKRLQHLRFE